MKSKSTAIHPAVSIAVATALAAAHYAPASADEHDAGRSSATTRLAAASSTPSGASGAGALEEIVVTGVNFRHDDVESANKMILAIKDTPQSVKVVTEDMLDFSGVTKFEDAYKIDAGAQTSNAQDGWVRTYFRGFRLDYDKALKIDGLRTPGLVAPDLSPFERFEIIKGATSTIYGQSQVAGTLNAVSKKPRADFGGQASLEMGSYDHYRGEIDLHGALTADQALTSRLVASYVDEDTFLDYGFSKRKVVAPALRYEFTPDTSLTFLAQYQQSEFNGSYGYGAQYTGPDTEEGRNDPRNYRWPDVPRSRLVGFPDANPDRELMFGRAVLEHSFENDWELRGSVLYTKSDVVNKGAYSGGVEPNGDTALYWYMSEGDGDAYAGEVNLFGDVEVLGREHTVFVGIDHSRDEIERLTGFGYIGDGAFNIFDPNYAALPRLPGQVAGYLDVGVPGYSGGISRSHDLYEETGATLQVILRPIERLSTLIGVRYSSFELKSGSECCDETALQPLPGGFGVDAENYDDDAVTMQFGATYEITPSLNAYASYGETFLPRNELMASADDPERGVRTDPEEGESYEIGLKGEAFGRQLLWSVAAFEIARTNITEDDPNDQIYDFVLPRGKQRSRGVELDFQGEVAPGWDVYGSFAVIDNEYVKGEFKGYSSFIAPQFGASLFSSYEIQNGPLTGLGFGGGAIYKQRGEVRQFNEPGQGLYFDHLFDDIFEVDARVFYRREAWLFQLSALNLFDTRYYSPVNNNFGSSVSVNPPRRVYGKVIYRFGK